MKKLYLLYILLFSLNHGFGQASETELTSILENMAEKNNRLDESARIDLSGLPLYDFINAIADEHELNVSVDPDLKEIVRSNFFDVPVKDILLFLTDKYDLKVHLMNGILVFEKKVVVDPQINRPPPKIDISYNPDSDNLSVRLKNDSLPLVARAITNATAKNIILSPEVKNRTVSAYILKRPFDQVLDLLAKSNDLIVEYDDSNNYFLTQNQEPVNAAVSRRPSGGGSRNVGALNRNATTSNIPRGIFEVTTDEFGFLNVNAHQGDVVGLIREAAEKLKINYYIYDSPEGLSTSLYANGIDFEELLDQILKGQPFSYFKEEDTYYIGKSTTEGIRSTKLVQLENRTIETVLKSIPTLFSQTLEIHEFVELNGFVVSGSRSEIKEFEDFIYEIDRVVPVIQIEVIIVQYQKGYEIKTGIQAGISNEPRQTSGQVFPATDVKLNSSSVNSLIDAFNGLGYINLGKVTDKFYLNLQALENNSLINVSSTPKLVTLNGHEANSSIGETNYYFEQNNQLITRGVNDNILQSGIWKSTEANLSISIKPIVSMDENVTLNIIVEKSSFLARAGENAPPGKATQKFQSMVRVKNNEMVLLGGLDELENENSGTGTPLLSRIPLLKWFFSSRNRKREKSKLHIFIKPTVIY